MIRKKKPTEGRSRQDDPNTATVGATGVAEGRLEDECRVDKGNGGDKKDGNVRME